MMIALALVACTSAPVDEGTAFYAQGEYDRAIEAYEQAGGEAPSAVVWFNLGDVHWREGDVARALACWRAAHDLAPRDSDTSHNLALARSAISGLPDPVAAPYNWMEFATPGEVGFLGCAALVAGAIGAARRRRRLAAGDDPTEAPLLWASPWAATWAAGAMFGAVAIAGAHAASERPITVIVEPDVPLRVEPLAESGTSGTLPAGAEVVVREHAGAFALIETSDGKSGWVVDDVLALR